VFGKRPPRSAYDSRTPINLLLDKLRNVFIRSSQTNVPRCVNDRFYLLKAGEIYATWTAIDADSKLILSYLCGERNAAWAESFMEDLASRVTTRIQLTTDGHKVYAEAVEGAFGMQVDYAMLIKLFGAPGEVVDGRYSPAKVIGIRTAVLSGNPDPDHIRPRIHGELVKLGFDLSERSVSRWVRRFPRDPDPSKRWLTFLRNHREAIAAMDFFTVPTLTFGVLYCFFVIGHDRRKILHFNVTRNPNALWIVQQLREAWAFRQPHRFLLFDRDSKFGTDVVSAVRDIGSQPTRLAFRSPWQNGVAERWVGSCRRDLLDHVIVLNERHLKRLMSEYVLYYHEDRTHLGLAKDTPAGRPTAIRPGAESKIQSLPRLGGLHHRYTVAE
jgi:transposase InsO family protein